MDEFVEGMDDPEAIRQRGETRREEHDDAYYERLAEQHRDQIEDEEEGFREMGLLDGGGENADTRPFVRRSAVPYRTREEREANPAVVTEGKWRPNPTPVADARREAAREGSGPVRERQEAAALDGVEVTEEGDAGPGVVAPAGAPVAASEVRPAGAVPVDDWIQRFTEVHMSVMDHLTTAVREGIAEIKGLIPQVGSENLGELTEAVGRLEEQLRFQASDGARNAETRRARWRWPLRVAAVLVGVAVFAGGAAVQSRWTVLDDGTYGWKDIVWREHGMKVAECIEKAARTGGGATCVVSPRVK